MMYQKKKLTEQWEITIFFFIWQIYNQNETDGN